ncbi:MAG: cytochrome c oxidase subunit II transmembrane domain-containing protein, partial [Anderseniella sp.]
MRKLFAGSAIFGASGAASSTSQAAGLGQPVEWQMNLQQAATPVMEFIHSFHNGLLVVITLICI